MKIRIFAIGIALSAIAPGYVCAQQFSASGNVDLTPSASDLQFSGSSRSAEIGPADGISLEASDDLSREPKSLPVAIHGQDHVNNALDAAALGNVPHVCDTPVVWQQQQMGGRNGQRSAIMHVLLRDDCNYAALWSGYPAERAQECAHMWSKLNRQSGCKSCNAGCGCDSAVSLAPRERHRPLNRYRQQPCDSCDALAQARALPSPQQNTQLASHPMQPAAQQTAHSYARPADGTHPSAANQPAVPRQATPPQTVPGRTSPSQPRANLGRPPYTASATPHQHAAVPVSYRR